MSIHDSNIIFTDLFNIERLKTLYTVARIGSIFRGAKKLNLSQPAVSRQIANLEKSLGVQLFYRMQSGLELTEEGKILFETAERVLEEVTKGKHLLTGYKNELKGSIKIVTTVSMGSIILPMCLTKFTMDYPDIKIMISAQNEPASLVAGEADILIWPGIPKECEDKGQLIKEKIATYHMRLYASPEYLKAYGTPQTPEDLKNHRLLAFGEGTSIGDYDVNWPLYLVPGQRLSPVVYLNNTQGLLTMGEIGGGIISLAQEFYDTLQTNLVPVLPAIKGPTSEVFCIYSKNLQEVKKIKLLTSLLKDKL